MESTGFGRVAILTQNIHGIVTYAESDPIIGDQYWTEITWNGKSEFPVKPGTPIWFRFRLNQAKIYGLEFE